MDTSFTSMCSTLGLADDVRSKAWQKWLSIRPEIDTKYLNESGFYCCCIYVTSIESNCPPLITVSDLVAAADIHVMTFFSCMRKLREIHIMAGASLKRFMGVEKRYCVSVALCDKLNQLSKAVFQKDEVPLNAPNDEEVKRLLNSEGVEYKRKLTWLIFLLTSNRVNPGCELVMAYHILISSLQYPHIQDRVNPGCELVMAYHILISSLQYVIQLTPAFQLQPPFDELKENVSGVMKELSDPSLSSIDEIMLVHVGVIVPGIQSLLADDGTLHVDELEESYMSWYRVSQGINELLILSKDTNTITSNVASETQCAEPVTPIKAALTSVQSLKKLLNSQIDQPSPALQAHFDNCSVNPTSAIKTRVKKYQDRFVDLFISTDNPKQKTVGTQRYRQATRLYYRTLLAILTMEEERLQQNDFTALLGKDEFHKSLLACCAEIVITTYGVSWNTSRQVMDSGQCDFSFPWILDVFELKAFYFYKVLESVIKAEPCMPKDIIRHLQGVENTILESIAWQQDSPLFEVMQCDNTQQCPTTPLKPDTLATAPLPSATDLYASPVFNRYPNKLRTSQPTSLPFSQFTSQPPKGTTSNQADLASTIPIADNKTEATKSQDLTKVTENESVPNTKSDEGEVTSSTEATTTSPRRSRSLTLFFNKVCRLGYHRLKLLSTLLNLPKDLENKIWTCLEHSITKKPELLKNRHLDQIMMCCVYALCKVTDVEVKFKVIVNVYKDLPHASIQTYRSVYISDDTHDSIITFYNKIFSQVMKAYILQFSKNKPLSPPLSPAPKTLNSPSASSFSLPGRPNFRVSPMKSLFKPPESPSHMTPNSRILYCYGDGIGLGEGSREKLKRINEEMAQVRRASDTPRSHKRLKFDDTSSSQSPDEEMHLPVITRTPVTPEKVKPSQ